MDEHGPITYMYGLNIKVSARFYKAPASRWQTALRALRCSHVNRPLYSMTSAIRIINRSTTGLLISPYLTLLYIRRSSHSPCSADSQQSTWHPCFQEKKSRTDANHSHQRLLAEKTALDASHARLLAELENERAQAHNAPSQNERRIVNARIRSNESLLQQNRQKAHQKDLEARAAWWRAIGVVIDTSQGDPTNGSWYDTIDPYGVHAQAQYSRVSDVTSNHTLVYSAQPDSGQGETRFYYTGHFAAPWQQY